MCDFLLDKFAFCEPNTKGQNCTSSAAKCCAKQLKKHGDVGAPLDAWYRIAKKAEWRNLMEVRRELPTADAAGKFTVFNIKGNSYRLITEINYETGRVFLRYVLTHPEYSKGAWR